MKGDREPRPHSGTSTLTFTYTVAAGQLANPLDAASAAALSGTIRDTVVNNPNPEVGRILP